MVVPEPTTWMVVVVVVVVVLWAVLASPLTSGVEFGSGGDDTQLSVGVKGGMDFEYGVDAANPVDLVLGVAPIKTVGVVDINLLGGKPFEAV